MLVPIRADAGADMACDHSGNLFLAEPFSYEILKFAPDGTTTTFATGVGGPLALDASGNLFAIDRTERILKLSPEAAKSTFAVEAGIPSSITFDAAGNLFVFDDNTGSIFKFAPTAKKSTFAKEKKHNPTRLACDRSGNLFVADYDSHSISKFTPDGVKSTFATEVQAFDLTIDAASNLFTVSYRSNTIFKFAPDGTKRRLETKLIAPEGLAFDVTGNLFVYDSEDPQKIVKLSPDGVWRYIRTKAKAPTLEVRFTGWEVGITSYPRRRKERSRVRNRETGYSADSGGALRRSRWHLRRCGANRLGAGLEALRLPLQARRALPDFTTVSARQRGMARVGFPRRR